jgi:L-arabinokinase
MSQSHDVAAELREFASRVRIDHGEMLGRVSFRAGVPITLARAPGRLDLMGGIADYSGSLVLQWPIREASLVAYQAGDDGAVEIESLASDSLTESRSCRIDAPEWSALRSMGEYASIRSAFGQRSESDHWAAYIAGVLLVLERERGVDVSGGARIRLRSGVPEGKGVSSSAAIEVATLRAAAASLGAAIDGVELATLCQMTENHVVGAPCGIMDQMASALGREHQLLALLCQPAEVQGYAALPDALGIWGIDSGIRHAVTGSDYTSVRVGAAMGYRMLTAGENPSYAGDRSSHRDTRWRGHLANIDVEVFEKALLESLPESLEGRKFLDRFHALVDGVVTVDPGRTYAVRQPTAHPVREHARVSRFAEILREGARTESERNELGRLMYGSHDSYSACGLGSEATDRLVEMVRAAGPSQGLYGAKITGGGSGGTVAVLGRAEAGPAVLAIARAYAEETGREPYVFEGSSPGAMEVEPIQMVLTTHE